MPALFICLYSGSAKGDTSSGASAQPQADSSASQPTTATPSPPDQTASACVAGQNVSPNQNEEAEFAQKMVSICTEGYIFAASMFHRLFRFRSLLCSVSIIRLFRMHGMANGFSCRQANPCALSVCVAMLLRQLLLLIQQHLTANSSIHAKIANQAPVVLRYALSLSLSSMSP